MFSYCKAKQILPKNNKNKKIKPIYQAQSPYISETKDKRAYNTGFFTAGSATVEATLIMPLMLMVIYMIWSVGCCMIMKNVIYEGLLETAEYMAEYEYLYELVEEGLISEGDLDVADTVVSVTSAYTNIKSYIDDEELVERYVTSGMNGLIFTEARYDDSDGFIYLTLNYEYGIDIPFFGEMTHIETETVKQKAYTGYIGAGCSDDEDTYVYITENATVYHTTRSCTHIDLSISSVSSEELSGQYGSLSACEYCTSSYTGNIYVTDEGDCYHHSLSCPGLKRTVYRVKKSETSLPACERCGRSRYDKRK